MRFKELTNVISYKFYHHFNFYYFLAFFFFVSVKESIRGEIAFFFSGVAAKSGSSSNFLEVLLLGYLGLVAIGDITVFARLTFFVFREMRFLSCTSPISFKF